MDTAAEAALSPPIVALAAQRSLTVEAINNTFIYKFGSGDTHAGSDSFRTHSLDYIKGRPEKAMMTDKAAEPHGNAVEMQMAGVLAASDASSSGRQPSSEASVVTGLRCEMHDKTTQTMS